MTALLVPGNMPFVVAVALLVLLALSQLIGLGDFDSDVDLDMDVDADVDLDTHVGIGDGIASLLGLGRLPLMAWITLAVGSFAVIGLAMQQTLNHLSGLMLPALPASGIALAGAIPAAALLARPIGRLWPKDETTAINIENLLARRGHIVIGTATRGSPARTAVRDQHGQIHHVMVEPHDEGMSFRQGDEVLLVRRDGETFFAVACEPSLLAGTD